MASSSIVPWLHIEFRVWRFLCRDFLLIFKVEVLHASFHQNWNWAHHHPPWYTQCQSGNIEGVVSPWQLLLLVQVLVHQSQLFCTAPQVTQKKASIRHHVLSEFFFKSWSNLNTCPQAVKNLENHIHDLTSWKTSQKGRPERGALLPLHSSPTQQSSNHALPPTKKKLLLHLDAPLPHRQGGPTNNNKSNLGSSSNLFRIMRVPAGAPYGRKLPKQAVISRCETEASTGLGPWSHQDKPGKSRKLSLLSADVVPKCFGS